MLLVWLSSFVNNYSKQVNETNVAGQVVKIPLRVVPDTNSTTFSPRGAVS